MYIFWLVIRSILIENVCCSERKELNEQNLKKNIHGRHLYFFQQLQTGASSRKWKSLNNAKLSLIFTLSLNRELKNNYKPTLRLRSNRKIFFCINHRIRYWKHVFMDINVRNNKSNTLKCNISVYAS